MTTLHTNNNNNNVDEETVSFIARENTTINTLIVNSKECGGESCPISNQVLKECHDPPEDEGFNDIVPFLQLPGLIREKIYTYLTQKDHLNIRFVCAQLLEEVDNFGDFSVIMKNSGRSAHHNVSIPFPYLKLLTIDNDEKDLPWKIDDLYPSPSSSSTTISSPRSKNDNEETTARTRMDNNCPRRQGSVQSVHLGAVSFQTFVHLSHYRTIQSATFTTNVFIRPIPSLNWTYLKCLRVKFHILCNQIESFMLDNFDSLCVQQFPHLETLAIAMCNTVYPNIQSAYSIRILRFVTKHWQSLRVLNVTMEAECCVSHHYVGPHLCPGLSDLDLADMKKVQLTSLTLNATELSCPRCSIWQEFIRQQTKLKSIEMSISCAMRLSSNFFCPVRPNSTKFLNSVIVTMWGMDGYFPFDFRHLDEATSLRNLEIVRHSQARSQLSRPELLNMTCIPMGLVSLTLNGFLISSSDVPILFKRMPCLRNLILIDCGFGLDIGVLLEHIPLLSRHPSYATAIIDFNTPVISSEEAVTMLSEEMDRHQLIFQYLFEIPTNKNHRFWFVHPDRVEETTNNLDKKSYPKDVLLSCDILSEYSQNLYFDDEFDDHDHNNNDHEDHHDLAMEPLSVMDPSYFHETNHPSHDEILAGASSDEFYHQQGESIPIAS